MERIEANGISISFKRSGEGPPLFLLHGAEADHSMFDAFGAALARHFTVIAYDQRDSGATRNPPSPYGLGELADDLAGLIAALGYARAHVFGTSFGGAIAQVAAVRNPACIDRLVLASTFRVGVSVASINPEGFPRFAELRGRLPESLPAFAEYFFAASYIAAHPEALAIFAGNKRDAGQRERRGAVLASGQDLARRDRGANIGTGGKRRPSDSACTYLVAGTRDSRRPQRDRRGRRPCRHDSGSGGGGGAGEGLSAKRKLKRMVEEDDDHGRAR
jgi:pimeloyl-ACP methyl ester carboxylesterase